MDKSLKWMLVSLVMSLLFLGMKAVAFCWSFSGAVFSDLIESVVHVLGVGFSLFCLWYSQRPADATHRFGHDRIVFFGAGVEGSTLCLGGIGLVVCMSVIKHPCFSYKALGMLSLAGLLNLSLGIALLKEGKKRASLLLQAHAKHLLFDTIVTAAVGIAFVMQRFFSWADQIAGIAIGVLMVGSGLSFLKQAVLKLLDQTDQNLQKEVEGVLKKLCSIEGISCHHIRHRESGEKLFVESHMIFPDEMSVVAAHKIATKIEKRLIESFARPCDFISHLEPKQAHDQVHQEILGKII